MRPSPNPKLLLAVLLLFPSVLSAESSSAPSDAERLVAAMLGATPLVDDLRDLTDRVGGRPTGSEANERAVEWAVDRLDRAGIEARTQPFPMPEHWLGGSAAATVEGAGVSFSPRIAAKPFSTPTSGALAAPLIDIGRGTEEDFARVGEKVRDAWVLVGTDLLEDVPGLFAEYMDGHAIEERAFAAGVVGVVYVGARPGDHLYRLNASRGVGNEYPLLVMDRTNGARAQRLLAEGIALTMKVQLDVETGGMFEAQNVLADIPGSESPEEIVVVGAHLDSWGLGTGALDNGSNVCMLIDIARQIERLGLRPKRTIRIALWNGEEHGLFGSWGYVQAEEASLDEHVAAFSFDIGTGRIDGFFTNGRGHEVEGVLEAALEPVAGLGPFTHHDDPLYGTDHFDFLIEGVAGLVASQESANYGPHYHASSDTFDKVDQKQLRLNSAVAAAVIWGFANAEVTWERWGPEAIRDVLIPGGLEAQMRAFGVWDAWEAGERGRHPAQ